MHSPWRALGILAGFLIAGPVRPDLLGAQQPVTITGRVTNEAGAECRRELEAVPRRCAGRAGRRS